VYINPFKIHLTSILSNVSVRKDTPVTVMPTKHLVPYNKTIGVSLKRTHIYKFTVWAKGGDFNVQPLATKLIDEL
jgi:hypothetical protein